jgi:LytR cell envelope-related transcriptional attenuator
MHILQEIGSYAGLAAVVGLAVMSALYFSQARDVKRLREWAGRAPERAGQPAAVQQAAQPKPVTAQPKPAGPAKPATPAAQPAAAGAQAGQGAKPAAKPVPVPVPAQAAAAGAAAATAQGPAAATPAAQSKQATAAPGEAPAADKADEKKPPEAAPSPTPAPAGAAGAPAAAAPGTAAGAATQTPPKTGDGAPPPSDGKEKEAATPAPATPAGTPPRRTIPTRPIKSPQPAPSQTAILPPYGQEPRPWYRRLLASPRYLVLAIAGVLIVGGAAAYGVDQLSKNESPKPKQQQQATSGGGGGGSTKKRKKAAPVSPANVTVAVLNGTTVPGLAAQIGDKLDSFGFQLGNVTNSSDQQRAESVVLYSPGAEREASAVGRKLGISQREAIDPQSQSLAGDARVVVIAGADKTQ